MRRTVIFCLALTLISINFNATSAAGSGEALSSVNKNHKRSAIKLFNGKNLDGWYTFIRGRGLNIDPEKVFSVQNRKIKISGKEYGCITTYEEFENYKLTVEFKWGDSTYTPRVSKTRDSGILLHSVGADGNSSGTWMNSIECQIIEGGTGDFIVVGDGTTNFSITCPVAAEKQNGSYVFNPSGNRVTINKGRINWYGRDPEWEDVKGFRGAGDVEKATGKWNRIECVVKDGGISVHVNGKLVNQAFDVLPRRGKIQIQSEGAEIIFRKINLKPLS